MQLASCFVSVIAWLLLTAARSANLGTLAA